MGTGGAQSKMLPSSHNYVCMSKSLVHGAHLSVLSDVCLISMLNDMCRQGFWDEFPIVCAEIAQSTWLVISPRAMNGFVTSSTFSSEENFEYHEHNIWNPLLESLCHSEVCVVMEALLDEVDMGSIALSCHFSLDVLCDKTSSIPVMNDHIFVRTWPPSERVTGNNGIAKGRGQRERVVCRQKHHPQLKKLMLACPKECGPHCPIAGTVSRRLIVRLSLCTRDLHRTCTCTGWWTMMRFVQAISVHGKVASSAQRSLPRLAMSIVHATTDRHLRGITRVGPLKMYILRLEQAGHSRLSSEL